MIRVQWRMARHHRLRRLAPHGDWEWREPRRHVPLARQLAVARERLGRFSTGRRGGARAKHGGV